MPRLPDEPLDLPGVPDGLVARPLREHRRDEHGALVEVRDRSGRRKLDLVMLTAPDEPPGDDPPAAPGAARPVAPGAAAPLAPGAAADDERWPATVPPATRGFVLGAGRRRWATVIDRFGEDAWPVACDLARAGIVRLVCAVDDRLAVATPRRWELTEPWAARVALGRGDRHADRERWQRRAELAVAALASSDPELAAALEEADPGGSSARILVCAAEDRLAGIVRDGPRAFSQAHFGDTKSHAHVDAVLRHSGVPTGTRQQLGVHRSQRLGVAGPVVLERTGATIEVARLDGLVELRADQPGLTLSVAPGAALVVVENLQAGEALTDRHRDLAVAYTAGMPSEASLSHLAALGEAAAHLAIAPDADAGGVRIAEAVLTRLGDATGQRAALLDVGAGPHRPSHPWRDDGPAKAALRRALPGPAAALARACLDRGYPVEQEATTIAAVEAWLARLGWTSATRH